MLRINKTFLPKLFNRVFVTLIVSMAFMARSSADERIAYYESKGELARYSIESHDKLPLRIVIFVKLRDGSLYLPKLYYYQDMQRRLAFEMWRKRAVYQLPPVRSSQASSFQLRKTSRSTYF